ncbi:MAG: hypothetical protein GQ538_07795, partial [Xanthomonadales bacterium]|nr:hypothetical protein [Xanthomonadales bacterium]
MRKFIPLALLLLAIIVIATFYFGDREPEQTELAGKPEQIKAVHYFSSSWPKSFWGDFEYSQVDSDFAQIKADGFNTIILVIPWMGFEINFGDDGSEPSELYERLDWLLAKIEEADLAYGLRVSFPHNFDPQTGTTNARLCTDIFLDSGLRESWIQYLSRIAERVDQHRDSFKFAFFSWEDFFCPYVSFPNMSKDQRLDMARRSGYQDWLSERYPLQLLEMLYNERLGSMQLIPVPERGSAAFLLFLQFVDQFLIEQLIEPGREVLPELAMEVRVDKDLIQNNSEIFWAGHDLAQSDEQLRGSYWGAYYGANNQGELLTAKQALVNFEFMLNEVSDHGKNINHIVEQFNFADNTPGFAGHAKIDEQELPAFLQGAAELLKQKSRGYGLWAYRDYVDSAIYNGSFELGLRGWETQGEAEIILNSDGDQALHMQTGAVISQTYNPYERFAGLGSDKQITFCANFTKMTEAARITLLLNGVPYAELDINDTSQNCSVMDAQAIQQSEVVFSVMTDAEIQIDDLRLYSYVQILDVYDKDGHPGALRDLIV